MWFAAVCSLMISVVPISRLLIPFATSERIWTSRNESPSGSPARGRVLPIARVRSSSARMPIRSARPSASPSSAAARSRLPRASSMRPYS